MVQTTSMALATPELSSKRRKLSAKPNKSRLYNSDLLSFRNWPRGDFSCDPMKYVTDPGKLHRIITEQICEVETQTIVFEQFHSSLGNFKHDLQRDSGSEGGYDSNIAGHYGNIVDGGGSLTTNDLGFKGQDVGSNYSTIGGSNWNNSTSPQSVKSAEDAAKAARNATTANNSTS